MATISKLKAILTLDNRAFKSGLSSSEKLTKGFSNQMTKLGGTIAAAFAITKIVAFGKELLEIGESAERVQKAFDNLDDRNLLANLRRATGNTVSDLELMQRAVQSAQFGIGTDQLVKGLELATITAAETGKSVDYLVDSFVTGVGRKSLPILDNLNISMLEMQTEIAKTGDFMTALGNVVDKRLGGASMTIEEAAKATDQLSTSWENLKLAMSDFANSPAVLQAIGAVTKLLQDMTPERATTADMETALERQKNYYNEIAETLVRINSGEEKANSEKVTFLLFEEAKVSANIKRLEKELALRKKINEVPQPGRQRQTVTPMASLSSTYERQFLSPDELEIGLGMIEDMNAALEDNAKAFVAASAASRLYAKDIQITGGAVLDLSQAISASLSQAIMLMADSIGQLIGGDTESALQTFIGGIAGLMKQFGALLISWGIAQLAIKASAGNPYIAIAAGAALVAIGGAMSAKQGQIGAASTGGSYGSYGSYGGGSYGSGGYSYDREIVFVQRGKDLVAVLNRQNANDYNNGGI